MNRELDEVISYIKNSFSYKKCIEIKKKMKSNCEICSLVEDIKMLQKQYVKGNYSDEAVKLELDLKEKRLEGIPLYIEYMNYLERVNEMINLVKDELNAYFIDLLSIEIKND